VRHTLRSGLRQTFTAALGCAAAVAILSGCGGGGGGGGAAVVIGRILLVTTNQPPNPAAQVTIGGSTVTTAADGTFRIENASPSSRQIRVTAAGMTALLQALPTLATNAVNDLGDIFLTNGAYDASVKGRVVRADDLQPVGGAVVWINGQRAVTPSSGTLPDGSSAVGTFEITGLPSGLGSPDVPSGMVRATGLQDKPLFFDPPLGSGMNNLGDVLISPLVGPIPGGPTNIRGVITLQGRTDASGATATLSRRSDGQVLGTVVVGADGAYGFWVVAGEYRLLLSAAGFQPRSFDIDLVRIDRPIVTNATLVP
jgi:hypothetical protein